MSTKNHFGFLAAIGSVVLLLLSPERFNNKRFLDKKYYKLCTCIGAVILFILVGVVLYFLIF